MISLPLSGWFSDRVLQSRKAVILGTMWGLCLLSGSVIWWTQTVPVWLVMATLFGIGVTAAPGQIMYAHIKELLPPTMVAQAMTAVNMFTVLGAGVMTHILGFVIGREPSNLAEPSDFSLVWYVGVITVGLACIMYGLVPESPAFKRADVEKGS